MDQQGRMEKKTLDTERCKNIDYLCINKFKESNWEIIIWLGRSEWTANLQGIQD